MAFLALALPFFAQPFLETHCQSCHNGIFRFGGVNFEVLKYANHFGPQACVWETTAYVLKTGRMLLLASPRPPQTEADAVRVMIEAALAPPPTPEWLTWQGDPERTGWARGETALTEEMCQDLQALSHHLRRASVYVRAGALS